MFRCTATTNRNCAGLSKTALSNHAYGLASDINSSINPMQTDYGVNGASACATAMKTDIPQWVVQVAQKWGLYWGGYGWDSGCDSPSQYRTSVYRDAMHFEYDGTTAQARAILLHNVGKGACFDVASTTGVVTNQCLLVTETPASGTRTVIHTNAPAGAVAALVNLTTVGVVSGGYLTAESCGPVPAGLHRTSNANTRNGRAVASTAIVRLDSNGDFCLFQAGSFHTIVDVSGFFLPSSATTTGTLFTPLTPTRVLDTRTDPVCTAAGVCLTTGPVPRLTTVAAAAASPVTATAVLANLTAINPSSVGYATVDTCTALAAGALGHSNLNWVTGDPAVSNLVLAPADNTDLGAQFCDEPTSNLHETIDVSGVFAAPADSPAGLAYTPATSTRLVDTRSCWTDPVDSIKHCGPVIANGIVRLKAPAGTPVVVVNLTTIGATTAGNLTIGACSVVTAGKGLLATLHSVVGAATSNLAVVQPDADGTYCVRTDTPAQVIVDLVGSFSATGALQFVATTPTRVHDSRPPK